MTGIRPFVAHALFILTITYLVIGGGTLAGILLPPYKIVTAVLVLPALAGWLAIRWRGGWRWGRMPLDGAVLLWIIAVALSFVANTESWRRMAIGLWYAGASLVILIIVQDLLTNRAVTRAFLVDTLLIAGVLVLLDGYTELFGLIQKWLDTPPDLRVEFYNSVRVWGRIGNPNWLVTFTILVAPLALARALTVKGPVLRAVLILYTALMGVLGFFTFSRAGWIGLGVMLVAFVALALFTWGRALLDGVRGRVARLPDQQARAVRIGAGALALIAVAGGIFVLVRISETGGRSLDDRLYLYATAGQLFAEQPVTGHGLFTFGEGVMRFNSVPYRQAHGSAHNLFLNIAAELGLVGLAALAVTIGVLLWSARRVWLATPSRAVRIFLTGGLAAVAGVAAQSFFDFTLTTPALTLVCLIVVAILTTPEHVVPVGRARNIIQTGGILALIAGLIAGAIWSNAGYNQYLAALGQAVQEDMDAQDYAQAAHTMQGAVDADPAMPVYSLYQGMFYALAAQRGDAASAPESIRAYERFVRMEPDFAPAWANLSLLYEEAGQPEAALDAARRAAEIAPKAAPLGMRLGSLYEAHGDTDAARAAYRAALDAAPDYALDTFWDETTLRRGVAGAPEVTDKRSETANVLSLLAAGQDEGARERLAAADRTKIDSLSRALLETLLPATPENQERLYALFDAQASRESFDTTDAEALSRIGRAAAACALGRTDEARAEAGRVDTLHESIPFSDADSTIGFFVQMQFYRIGVAPFFLPGETWPVFGPITEQFWRLYQDRYPDCRAG